MSPREGVYYAVWMAGIIVGVSISRLLGWHHFAGLAIGLILGLGMATLAEKAYVNHFQGRGPRKKTGPSNANQILSGDEIACRNPKCDWVGISREKMFCPKCSERFD